MRNSLERSLYQYGKACRQEKSPRRDAVVLGLMERAKRKQPENTMFDIVLTNLGMLGRYCLVWQVLWFVLFLLVGMSKQVTRLEFEVLLSIFPPLLVVLTADNISRIYNRSMLEIECTTKYSVTQIVMLRMSVLTFSNYFLVLAGILILQSGLKGHLMELLLYGFTPMILSEAILIQLMKHLKGEELKTAGFVVYAVIVSASVIVKLGIWDAYQMENLWVWQLILLFGVVWMIVGFIRLGKELSNYGIGNKKYYEEI